MHRRLLQFVDDLTDCHNAITDAIQASSPSELAIFLISQTPFNFSLQPGTVEPNAAVIAQQANHSATVPAVA